MPSFMAEYPNMGIIILTSAVDEKQIQELLAYYLSILA